MRTDACGSSETPDGNSNVPTCCVPLTASVTAQSLASTAPSLDVLRTTIHSPPLPKPANLSAGGGCLRVRSLARALRPDSAAACTATLTAAVVEVVEVEVDVDVVVVVEVRDLSGSCVSCCNRRRYSSISASSHSLGEKRDHTKQGGGGGAR